jgi:hypothetical protein
MFSRRSGVDRLLYRQLAGRIYMAILITQSGDGRGKPYLVRVQSGACIAFSGTCDPWVPRSYPDRYASC